MTFLRRLNCFKGIFFLGLCQIQNCGNLFQNGVVVIISLFSQYIIVIRIMEDMIMKTDYEGANCSLN